MKFAKNQNAKLIVTKIISTSFFEHKILTCQGLECVQFKVGNNVCSFLIDTGATLSVIHKSKVPQYITLQSDDTVIKGIGGNIHSHEQACLTLYHYSSQTKSSSYNDSTQFNFVFHVLNKMPCQADGIIGLDFLRTFNADINLLHNELTLQNNSKQVKINLSKSYLHIPSRCESIHFIEVNPELKNECVVIQKQLAENVFLAGSIVRPINGKIPIKILNTSESSIKLPSFKPDLENLDDYVLCQYSQTKSNVDRVKKLLSI